MATELGWMEYHKTNDNQYRIRDCLVVMLGEVAKISNLAAETHLADITEIGDFADEIENQIIDRLKVCRDSEKYCLSQLDRIAKSQKTQQEKNI